MVRHLLILVLIATCFHPAFAQDDDKIYLNGTLAATSKKSASFYRVAEGRDGDLFIGRTYSIDGKLRSEGTYLDAQLRVEHGAFTFFHTNGALESRGEYVMGNKSGIWERFTANGDTLAEKIYNHVPLENIVYTMAETMPRNPKGSEKEFVRYIKSSVSSTNGKRVKGKVMASLIVEKNGSLTDVKVVEGKDPRVNDRVVQAIRSTEPWQPGMDKGQPVRVVVRIPVQF